MADKTKDKKKKKKVDKTWTLEECITERPLMLNWILHLGSEFALGSFVFWLETQNFKYIRDQDGIKTAAGALYEKYFSPKGIGINIDDCNLLNDLADKIKRPQRTTFMLVQNAIWTLLKLELYPRFQVSPGFKNKIGSKELKLVVQKHDFAVQQLDKFLSNNATIPIEGVFKPHILPDDHYEEHLHSHLPSIGELFKDGDLFLAFREYLYAQFANENLSFYIEACHYEKLPEKEFVPRAKDIYHKYIVSGAPYQINLGKKVTSTIASSYEKATKDTFSEAKETIFKILEIEWFPNFLVSPTYQACNEEKIVYTHTGKRKRSETIKFFESVYGLSVADPYALSNSK